MMQLVNFDSSSLLFWSEVLKKTDSNEIGLFIFVLLGFLGVHALFLFIKDFTPMRCACWKLSFGA